RACCRRRSPWPSSLAFARSSRTASRRCGGSRRTAPPTSCTAICGPSTAPPDVLHGIMRPLNRAEKAMDADLPKSLPLWKLAVPAEFENYHAWDFSKFGRGERFVNKPLPRGEFDEVFAQVETWGLDQYLKER